MSLLVPVACDSPKGLAHLLYRKPLVIWKIVPKAGHEMRAKESWEKYLMRVSEQFLELVCVFKETCRNFIQGRLKFKTIGAYTESIQYKSVLVTN
jgi:hypothetical protein